MKNETTQQDAAPLMKRTEVAEKLCVSGRTVIRLARRGLLPELRLGSNTVRYRCEDVAALIASAT